MEAMAHGIAVVATRVGGIPEIVENGQTGLLVEAKNANDLFDKIVYLIKNPHIQKKLGERARQSIQQRFSVQEFIRETTRLYEGLNHAGE
jgi:glycosyltransferase involved in cell wall biosynthesis